MYIAIIFVTFLENDGQNEPVRLKRKDTNHWVKER